MTEDFDAPTAMACLHLSDGAAQQHFVGHSDWIRGLELIDERRLLSWSDDHDLRLWDLESGRCLQRLTGMKPCAAAVPSTRGPDVLVRGWNLEVLGSQHR